MALKIVKTFNVKKDDGSLLFSTISGNVFGPEIRKEGLTGSVVDQAIVDEVAARVQSSQGNADLLASVLALLGQ
jgi:hypothetical protein